jgi:hypothetical protein
MKHVIEKHQTILDLAMQHCGTADALFDIAELNDIDVTSEVAAGQEVDMPDAIDTSRVKFLSDGGHKPVTGSLVAVEDAQGGLEYWAIEIDFVIS